MGIGEVERAVEEHGDRVVGVTFTPMNKLDIALAMKKRFEDGTIRIDADADVRTDFRAIKKAKGVGEAVRLVNDSEEVHADMFWACALACKMAEMDAPACHGYRAAERVRKFDEGKGQRGPGFMRMRARDRPPTRGKFGGGSW
jgi:phage FluMu gp28-like protein